MADLRARSRDQPGPCEVEDVEVVVWHYVTLAFGSHLDIKCRPGCCMKGQVVIARNGRVHSNLRNTNSMLEKPCQR